MTPLRRRGQAQQERVLERREPVPFEPARGAAVAGRHVGDQQQGVRVGPRGAQLRHPLGGVPVWDLGVLEVRERVLLAQELAVLVPGAPELRSAAHVRDRHHETTVEQGEAFRPEVGHHHPAVTVCAVSLQEERGGAVEADASSVDERDRHPLPVGGRRLDATHLVARRLEAAGDTTPGAITRCGCIASDPPGAPAGSAFAAARSPTLPARTVPPRTTPCSRSRCRTASRAAARARSSPCTAPRRRSAEPRTAVPRRRSRPG